MDHKYPYYSISWLSYTLLFILLKTYLDENFNENVYEIFYNLEYSRIV